MTSDLEQMKEKWRRILTGGAKLDCTDFRIAGHLSEIGANARRFWETLERKPGREWLWSDLSGTQSSDLITRAYIRIKELALAFVLPGTGLQGNPDLREDVIAALDWMHENRYHPGMKPYSNWWHWQIGAPLALNDTVFLMSEHLSKNRIADFMNAIDAFVPRPLKENHTGANRIWLCLVKAYRSILLEDAGGLSEVRREISPVFPYVEAGDGFYRDGSFIQHGSFAYTGSYGRSMLLDLSKLLYLFAGTAWEITDPRHKNVYRWVFDGFEPVMFRGALMDMVRGREISRSFSQDHDSGHHVIEAVMRLAQVAPPEDARRMRRMAKDWILADTCLPIARHEQVPYGMASSVEKVVLAAGLLKDESVTPRGEYMKCKIFSSMDRVVFHRGRFAAGISMFSSRISSYESINGENLKGWYTAHGMVYLYNEDLGQFSDAFWPTVNPYRLPGTTVTSARLEDGFGRHRRSSKSWAGGAALMDMYGAAGMELEDYPHRSGAEPLTARKSWFLFDEEIIALGSGIHTGEDFRVETIVENRKLSETGDNVLLVNGIPKPNHPGWAEELKETRWIHLAGSGGGGDIGYYFPEAETVQALRETRSGTWRGICTGEGSDDDVEKILTRHYLTLVIDHGIRPEQERYAYVLLPGMNGSQVEEYAANPRIEILEQSGEAHAVFHRQLNLWGVNFWSESVKTAGPLTARGKAAVLLKITGDEIAIAVSDPTHLQDQVILEAALGAKAVIRADPGIAVERLTPSIRFTIDVRGSRGRTFQAIFSR
jgi:hyaluronate lyase